MKERKLVCGGYCRAPLFTLSPGDWGVSTSLPLLVTSNESSGNFRKTDHSMGLGMALFFLFLFGRSQ